MLLLQLQLQMQTALPFAPHEAPYKGGVLHGLVEHALTRHHPQLWNHLRGPHNQRPHYALRVPQDSDTHWPEGHVFELGLMLYAPAQALWADVLAALTQGAPLRLGQARAPCTALDLRIHRPGAPSLSLLQAMGQAGQALPHWQATLPEPKPSGPHDSASPPPTDLHILLHAPCHINSQSRRHLPPDQAQPFTLTSIVRSVQRRLQTLEPALATQCGLGTPEWQHAMQSIWPHHIAQPAHTHIWPRPWPYASRNTPGHAPVRMPALQGQLHYHTPLPPMVAHVLDIGQWMGMGQKTSLGMGWYGVKMKSDKEKENDRETP